MTIFEECNSMIVYFSATGNSRYCAAYLGRRLDDEQVDCAPFLRRQEALSLASQRPWIFVCPTYAWQAPRVFVDLLRRSSFTGSREAYFVMTCGGETGNAQAGLQALCREKGLTYKGLFPIVMPDNYLVMFKTPGPKEAREILVAARPKLEEAARAIQHGEDAPALPVKLMDRVKSGPINEGMYRCFIGTGKFRITDRCIHCGRCAEVCPLSNIRLSGGTPVWGKTCTHCMACISLCSKEAIEYGTSTRGKVRYRCPDDPA